MAPPHKVILVGGAFIYNGRKVNPLEEKKRQGATDSFFTGLFKDSRKLGLLIACTLGMILILYLGGLVGQLIAGYEIWLHSGGLDNAFEMPPIQTSPGICIGNAFSKSGLKGTLFLLLIFGGIAIYAKLQGKWGKGEYDDRNFKRSELGTYGTSGWMDEKEVKANLEVTTAAKAKGTILGKQNGSLICLPVDTHLNPHIAVFGASGTRKSRGFVRPHLMQCIRRGESVIVTDPKSDLYTDMAAYFRDSGYTVKVYNLVSPQHGDSWNCMADLDGDTLMAQVLVDVIIANTGSGKSDHFWDNGEANFLKSLILNVDRSSIRKPEEKHLAAVYQELTQNPTALFRVLDNLPYGHPAKAPYNLFKQASDTVRSGIILGLGTRLQILQNEAVCRITSYSDIDLVEPGRSKCAYFLIMSDQDRTMDFLSSLFFSCLFIRLVRFADAQPSGKCPVPVNFVLDEFNNIGVISDFSRKISVLRSRDIRISMCLQNLAQIQNRYPDNLWAEILGNTDTQLLLGCTDALTANYISERTGDMTVQVNSTMTVKKTIAVAQVIPQYRHNEGVGKRRLMTPDEVLRLPNDDMLVMLRGQKVFKCQKIDYTELPDARKLSKSYVQDYKPHRRYAQEEPLHREQPSGTPIALTVGTSLFDAGETPPSDF